MSEEQTPLDGPDFAAGAALTDVTEGKMLRGHTQGEPVMLTRRGNDLYAIGATCTHYGAPLNEGLLVGDTVRCPWHHACFSLRSGEALHAPALSPVSCWHVEQKDGKVFIREKLPEKTPMALPETPGLPQKIVIVGGGAAGNAAAEMLRREGYLGSLTMLSSDSSVPYDRPNLTKGYLSGSAPQEWIPLRSPEFYAEQKIDLKLNTTVTAIDTAQRQVSTDDGATYSYDALLLATGAEPVRLPIPGAELPHVHYLRSLDDATALIESATKANQVVIIGASFIGLEAAASLRARKLPIQIVGREAHLMERVLGTEVGDYLRELHESNGVTFHLDAGVTSIDAKHVTLADGTQLNADLVLIGIGVKPRLQLADQAGLKQNRGVVVDQYLRSSDPHIYAAGDIARWPDRVSETEIRVEHWAVAEHLGQTAARNMLGRQQPFEIVPFFWTEQYDFTLAYTGHAEQWDEIQFDGSLAERDCSITYFYKGHKLAVATVQRDLVGLHAEADFEHLIASKRK